MLVRELMKYGQVEEALHAYEAERRPATSKIVHANRGDGPDIVMDIVEERARDGFENLDDVLNKTERETIAASYKETAGFGIEQLNSAEPILPERA
ncbi:hypothetical protein MNBD_ALPHA03-1609 [hydrothermal vent metagenome]|uniref:Salicylate hydroxylase n=1 Tax=hydrothermal vent metagenome TaxID=652676 RepID=A0A3B1AYH7_9ZZZZ